MTQDLSTSFDLVVIGGGPAGHAGAIRAAQRGWRVALVEAEARLGGICLNWGCIPTKALLHQAQVMRMLQGASRGGLQVRGEIGVDWERLIQHSRTVTDRLAAGVAGLMKRHRVTVLHGRARLTPGADVEVTAAADPAAQLQAQQVLQAQRVLLATGGRPRSLPGIEAAAHPRVISSREAMVLPERPRSIVIIGAGAIGVEFASFFRAFGTRVTLLEAAGQILPAEDEEVAGVVRQALAEQGVEIHTGVHIDSLDGGPRRRTAIVSWRTDGDAPQRQRVDVALVAVGVTGNVEGLGLEALGIRAEAGAIAVDGRYRTSAQGVWAAGDVIGGPRLAHAATAEALAAVDDMDDRRHRPVDVTSIPSCVYSHPQVASVGLSEAAARARGVEIKVGRFPFRASGRALASGETAGLIKLVFGARYGELLGAALAGPDVTELIGELCLALRLEATWEELAGTVHAHPTLSEGIAEAAAAAFGAAVYI